MIRLLVVIYAVFMCACSALYDQARKSDAVLTDVERRYELALHSIEETKEPHYSARRAEIEDCFGPIFQSYDAFLLAWYVAIDHPGDKTAERASALFSIFEMLSRSVCTEVP